jgi:hypothetical protein
MKYEKQVQSDSRHSLNTQSILSRAPESVYTLLFFLLSVRQFPYVHAISYFISGVCTLNCASQNSFGGEIWTLHNDIFDLPDQPLNFRSKGTFFFASFFPSPIISESPLY